MKSEFRQLPCGHEVIKSDALEITCLTCGKVYQCVGLRLEAQKKWRLPVEQKTRIRL